MNQHVIPFITLLLIITDHLRLAICYTTFIYITVYIQDPSFNQCQHATNMPNVRHIAIVRSGLARQRRENEENKINDHLLLTRSAAGSTAKSNRIPSAWPASSQDLTDPWWPAETWTNYLSRPYIWTNMPIPTPTGSEVFVEHAKIDTIIQLTTSTSRSYMYKIQDPGVIPTGRSITTKMRWLADHCHRQAMPAITPLSFMIDEEQPMRNIAEGHGEHRAVIAIARHRSTIIESSPIAGALAGRRSVLQAVTPAYVIYPIIRSSHLNTSLFKNNDPADDEDDEDPSSRTTYECSQDKR